MNTNEIHINNSSVSGEESLQDGQAAIRYFNLEAREFLARETYTIIRLA